MRAVRPIVVTLALLIGGYLFGLANGVYGAIQERKQGWNITPLPSHPLSHVVVYAAGAIALQLFSAWLLMPTTLMRGISRQWARYLVTVAVCIGGCFVVMFVILFIVMALLDAGTI